MPVTKLLRFGLLALTFSFMLFLGCAPPPGVMRDDFLVNDDVAGGGNQDFPAVTLDPAGNFIIAWQDGRWPTYWDIYAQKYNSSGTPQGIGNFRVNRDPVGSVQWRPDIASDGAGNFVVTWKDFRDANGGDVYARRFNAAAASDDFQVNEDIGVCWEYYAPAIDMDGSGNFVITWEERRDADVDIYFQMFNSSGNPVSNNIKVNDDAGTANQKWPDIAMDGTGNFIIAWEDHRNGNWDIYARRFDASGAPLAASVRVNDDPGTNSQQYAAIASDGSGNFIITWTDRRNGSSDIYFQIFDSNGDIVDNNKRASDAATAVQSQPAVAVDDAGRFVITWQDSRNFTSDDYSDIYAQRFDPDGNPNVSNFKVNDDGGTTGQMHPDVALNNEGKFVITWQDSRYGNADIYAQMFDFSSSPVGSNFKVNDDKPWQRTPDIAIDGAGGFGITWADTRNSDLDIYAQRYSPASAALGSNFRVNDDTGSTKQWEPAIASGGTGNVVITWIDDRNGEIAIWAQMFNSSGDRLGENFKVNEDPGPCLGPDVAMDISGNFVITWHGGSSGPKVYAQRYSSSGAPTGSNFIVNEASSTLCKGWYPAIAMSNSGSFVIAWDDIRLSNTGLGANAIYAQIYKSDGDPVGENFKVSDESQAVNFDFSSIAIAVDASGNFVISWLYTDNDTPTATIYVQRFDDEGNRLDNNNIVVVADLSATLRYPDIGMDIPGNFVITWHGTPSSGGTGILAQRYSSSGSPIGSSYLVNNPQSPQSMCRHPAVAANASNIFYAWVDNRRESDFDIYAKVVEWEWTGD